MKGYVVCVYKSIMKMLKKDYAAKAKSSCRKISRSFW